MAGRRRDGLCVAASGRGHPWPVADDGAAAGRGPVRHGRAGRRRAGPRARCSPLSRAPEPASRARRWRGGSRGRERELGLVLHADTFFGDGPAADDPGEVRGIGAPAPVDAGTGRELAAGRLSTRATCVLLADRYGSVRTAAAGRAATRGWLDPRAPGRRDQGPARQGTRRPRRDRLSTDAVRADRRRSATTSAPATPPAPGPAATAPPAAVTWTMTSRGHAAPRPSPTSTPRADAATAGKPSDCGDPRCTQTASITWTTLAGTRLTHRPEPLPGYGPGEAYAPTGHTDAPAA